MAGPSINCERLCVGHGEDGADVWCRGAPAHEECALMRKSRVRVANCAVGDSRLGNIVVGYLAAVVVADAIVIGEIFLTATNLRSKPDVVSALVGLLLGLGILLKFTLLPAAAIIWQ